jgi:hypothetical protein
MASAAAVSLYEIADPFANLQLLSFSVARLRQPVQVGSVMRTLGLLGKASELHCLLSLVARLHCGCPRQRP